MKLTFDFDEETGSYDEEGNRRSLTDHIIDAAAARLLNQLLARGDDAIAELRRRAESIRDDVLWGTVAPIVERAVVEFEVQPTNEYGEARGQKLSLVEFIAREVKLNLTARSYASQKPPLLESIVKEQVGQRLERELKDAIDQAKAEVIAAVREKGAAVLAKTIVSMAEARGER
jgi:hypothetical protein